MSTDRYRQPSRLKRHISVTASLSVLVLTVLLKAGWCSAATFTWTGSVSSDWFNANNWTPVGVPGSSDTINFTNGTINLTSAVTVNGPFSWSGGSLTGYPLSLASGGVMNITGAVTLQNVLTNGGTVTMSGAGNLSVYNNLVNYQGGVHNLAGALWDLQTNANIYCACYGHEFFNNAGDFRKSQGSGTSTIYVSFTNAGTVTNLMGTLSFAGGGALAGGYGTASGATIGFTTGNFTMGVAPAISGSGLCELTGGTLTLTQDAPPNLVLAGGNVVVGPAFQEAGGITNLTLSGSTLVSTNTVTGTFTWMGGVLAGSLSVASGGVMNIAGAVTLQNVLTNGGTVTMSGAGSLSLYNNVVNYQGGVYNLAGALWDLQTNANIYCACYGHEFFNNAGDFRKSQGPGTSTIYVGFTNTGTVTSLMGVLSFAAGGALTGGYDTAAGATINFAGGNFTMGVAPAISGSGLCELTGGTLTLTQDAPPNLVLAGGNVVVGPAFQDAGGITNLTLSGSTLVSTNTVTGTFTWMGGVFAGPLSVASGGVMNITGAVTLQNVLTNGGTVTMSGAGSLSVYNNAVNYQGGVYNLAGALWDLQTNANIYCACYGHEFFNNAGAFRKSQGSGTSTIYVGFTNTGTVTSLMGILSFAAGGALTGGYDTAAGATISFAGGNFTMGVAPAISGSGLCELTGGTLTLTQDAPPNLVLAGGNVVVGPAFQEAGGITNLTVSGSTLVGTNTVTGTVNWTGGLLAGPLSVASGGVMNITGNVALQNVLTNGGTVTMSGAATLNMANNLVNYQGGVYNLAGALWDLQTNANIYCACYGHEFFNNAGDFASPRVRARPPFTSVSPTPAR